MHLNSIRKNKLGNKVSKRYAKLIFWKLQSIVKKIKELNKWKGISCSWIGSLNIVQIAVLLKLIYKINSYKNSSYILCRSWQVNPKIHMDIKEFRIVETILKKKKNNIGWITLPNFKIYLKATVIKTMWCWYDDRQIIGWNRTESPKLSRYIYGQLIFDKDTKTIQQGKE